MQILLDWFKRQLNNPQIIILSVFLIIGFTLIIYAGKMIAPVIAAAVIAYILEGGVKACEAIKLPRLTSVLILLGLFFVLIVALVFGILPLVIQQALQLVAQVPGWVVDARDAFA